MEGFQDKNKIHYFMYELVGTMLVTVSYNLTSQYVFTILIVSIWSWEVSAAHFNMAITLGDFIYNTRSLEKLKNNIVPFLALIFVQFIGSLMGIFITFLCSYI